MLIELTPIERLKPYPVNPRDNDDVVPGVAASLREFGFRLPIVVDSDFAMVVSHIRLKAAQSLGLTQGAFTWPRTDLSPIPLTECDQRF